MDDRRGTSSGQPYADDIERWLGGDIHDPEGDKIGEVADVYYDEETKQPEWLSVGVGWFGKIRLIPATRVEKTGQGLRVPYSKDQVKDSPEVDGEIVSQAEEQRLASYYGLDYEAQPNDPCEPGAETKPGIATAGIESVDVSRAVLRSREQREADSTGAEDSDRVQSERRFKRPSECARMSRAASDESIAS